MGEPRVVHIVHFNDVYNIEAAARDPVGGAAKFVSKVRSLGHLNPLVLFSGDCFNPSLMSTITLGKQMVPILNLLNVKAACVGNHDWDMGLDNFRQLAAQCHFPWLLSNVLDKRTDKPMGGALPTLLLEWGGVKLGLVGLAEGEWVDTLGVVEPEDVTYRDFVAEGRRLAQQLRAEGAEVVIALTHMRVPNDRMLLAEVGDIDVVLGGHDHHYEVGMVEPHNNLLVKSGTDFRELTHLTLTLPAAASSSSGSGSTAAGAGPEQVAARPDLQQGVEGGADYSSSEVTADGMLFSPNRPVMKWQQIQITSSIADDPEAAQLVKEYASIMGEHMDEEIGHTQVDLDGRFTSVRTKETNLGNLVADVFRKAANADVALLNSGTLRSDTLHPAGPLTCRDLVSILPMMDDTVVIQVTGEQLLGALENGVSHYPQLEGRFPQVSGVRFSFDPSSPPQHRVVADSVTVGGVPLSPSATYRLATKEYLADGKDGYTMLEGSPLLVDAENSVLLPTAMRHFFLVLQILGAMDRKVHLQGLAKHWHSKATGNGEGSPRKQEQQAEANKKHSMCVRDPVAGCYAVSPAVDGRITCIGQ